MGDKRTDSGQYYPGGKVIPRQPVRPGGGSDADAVHYYAETKTDDQKAQARQNIGAAASGDIPILDRSMTTTEPTEDGHGLTKRGIWSWVKSLLPNWLTSNYAEPATVQSVNQKYTKPSDGIPKSDLNANVQSSLNKADSASQPGHTHPQSQVDGLADALAAKRDKTDEGCYGKSFSSWSVGVFDNDRLRRSFEASSFQPYYLGDGKWDLSSGIPDVEDASLRWYCSYDTYDGGPDLLLISAGWFLSVSEEEELIASMSLVRTASATPDPSHKLARRDADAASAIAKFDAAGNLVADNSGKGLSKNDYTDADKAEVAKVKDKADEFAEWFDFRVSDSASDALIGANPDVRVGDGGGWYVSGLAGGWNSMGEAGGPESTEIAIEIGRGVDDTGVFYATRKRVLRTGEALAPGLDDDGVPTDAHVRDLFSKSDTFATDGHLKNSVLEGSVNALIDAKVGNVNAVLAAALDGSEVE